VLVERDAAGDIRMLGAGDLSGRIDALADEMVEKHAKARSPSLAGANADRTGLQVEVVGVEPAELGATQAAAAQDRDHRDIADIEGVGVGDVQQRGDLLDAQKPPPPTGFGGVGDTNGCALAIPGP